jgi:UDP-GlcNAc3NAcA epimerase
MSDVFFEQLGIPVPEYQLGVGSGAHGAQTGEMLKRIEEVLLRENPDWLLVYGDTNSTLAGALAASKVHVPIAHVEAGLRSFNRRMPEEINRVVTDHLSSIHFCPTTTAVNNLANEGIFDQVHLVGDVMHDVLIHNLVLADQQSTVLQRLELAERSYCLATVHRAESTDDPAVLAGILQALNQLAEDGMRIVFPVHPRTRGRLKAHVGTMDANIQLIEPVAYLDMLRLAQRAKLTLTDSGGLQKEACWLSVPCVTLRDQTEWVETIELGANVLAGTSTEKIIQAARRQMASRPAWRNGNPPRAAERIVECLLEQCRRSELVGLKPLHSQRVA